MHLAGELKSWRLVRETLTHRWDKNWVAGIPGGQIALFITDYCTPTHIRSGLLNGESSLKIPILTAKCLNFRRSLNQANQLDYKA
jgi:hypothetical protein